MKLNLDEFVGRTRILTANLSLDQIMVLKDCMADIGFDYADGEFYEALINESDRHSKPQAATSVQMRLMKPGEPLTITLGKGNVAFGSIEELARVIRYLDDAELHNNAVKTFVLMKLRSLLKSAQESPDRDIHHN